MSLNDTKLIQMFLKGDQNAFEELVHRYDKRVLALALKFTRDKDEAKDIYQEVFIRVYKGLKNFESRSQFSTWLYRITTNVCLTQQSRKKKYQHISIYDSQNYDDDETPGVEAMLKSDSRTNSRVEGREIKERVEVAMEVLSKQEKIVFTLRHLEEFKLKEIANMMECAEGTVKKYLFNATQKMRELL